MVYIIDIYHFGFVMTKTTAKLFMHGRSQAVRLPKEFRMPGTEVEISRDGDVIELKPIPQRTTDVDWDKFWSDLDALGDDDPYPDGWRQQKPVSAKPRVKLD
jgi:antitoxin VapB